MLFWWGMWQFDLDKWLPGLISSAFQLWTLQWDTPAGLMRLMYRLIFQFLLHICACLLSDSLYKDLKRLMIGPWLHEIIFSASNTHFWAFISFSTDTELDADVNMQGDLSCHSLSCHNSISILLIICTTLKNSEKIILQIKINGNKLVDNK